jgi:endoglucanase
LIAFRPVVVAVLVAIVGASACVGDSGSDPDPPASSGSTRSPGSPPPPTVDAFVRVDQVGYPLDASARAYLLSTHEVAGATFALVADDAVAASGAVGQDLGRWSAGVPHVYAIDFSVGEPGTYTIEVSGPVVATSPAFRIAAPTDLYRPVLVNARTFYRAQRDGPDVIRSVMDRRPSHLHDRDARVFRELAFTPDLVPKLPDRVVGARRVDASGGWFDAGDYVKGVQTASYAAALLLTARRDFPELVGPGSGADLTGELTFELDWLQRMWDDESGVLHYQLAVGDGSEEFAGDHDLWRLPQADDTYGGRDPYYRFIRHRPLFRAGPPGAAVSPNLAGRLAASFGLCAQMFHETRPAYAERCLAAGEHIFDLADTSPDGRLLTFSPFDFYPETEWRSDLELGAAELALALAERPRSRLLIHRDPEYYVKRAAHWARSYVDGPDAGGDTLNLYDVSALAHAELIRAISLADRPSELVIDQSTLLADMNRQLAGARMQAQRDPFGFGFPYAAYDGTSHAQGLAITALLYNRLTGTTAYLDFAARQLDVILGANAWGASFIVGAGTSFPFCVHHQIANLTGGLDGSAPILLGAAVNGTNSRGEFQDLGLPEDARRCPPVSENLYGRFDGKGARYWDNVRSWPTVEPAIDFVATTPLAFALLTSATS